MRHILRRRELIEDDWRYVGETVAEAAALIVPFAEFRTNPGKWRTYPGALGVRLTAADRVEDIGADLTRFTLIAVEFPTPTDGRGYSHGRILRTRLQFQGELRAVGAVKQDQIFFLARCGFDSFELAEGENVEEALRALQRYTVAYQPADARVPISRQRFFARGN